jgi:hypothetical protein
MMPCNNSCYLSHDALQQFLLPAAVFRYKCDVRSFRSLARSTSHEAVLPAVLALVLVLVDASSSTSA